MRQTDIAIVGGGLAGSLAAAMLGRAGHDVVLVDPHEIYPADFRCEKLDTTQIRILAKTDLSEHVLPATTPDRGLWVARQGRVIERRAGGQYGFFYDTLINTLRSAIPDHTGRVYSKAAEITTSADRQTVRLANGDGISARLVVLANGLNVGLRQKLGIERKILSACHSVTIGFNLAPAEQAAFPFCALTYYSERPSSRTSYITLFPIGDTTRANLFVYRELDDPWLRQFRTSPQQTLFEAMPRLEPILGRFNVTDFVKIRPIDLYVTTNYRQPGIVLAGDAFASSCPATGLGARKVLTDIERLCNLHIPSWLATPGMGAEKTATYYDDPIKVATDAHSAAEAYALRSFSIEQGLRWSAERWVKFALRGALGAFRQMYNDPAPHAPETAGTSPAQSAPRLGGASEPAPLK